MAQVFKEKCWKQFQLKGGVMIPANGEVAKISKTRDKDSCAQTNIKYVKLYIISRATNEKFAEAMVQSSGGVIKLEAKLLGGAKFRPDLRTRTISDTGGDYRFILKIK